MVFDLLLIPDDMQLNVIRHIHKHNHFACKHCEAAIKEQFFISNLSAKTDKLLTICVTCILCNWKKGKQELQPLPKKNRPF